MREAEVRVLAAEPAASRLERWSFNGVLAVLAGSALLLLVAPTLVVLVTSFTSAFSLKFPPPGYSLRWYEALLFDSPEIVEAAWVSFKVAGSATIASVLLGTSAALGLARRRETWARLVDSLFMSPLMLPTLALGLALLVLFNLAGTGLSVATLVAGHVAITSPYVLRTTTAALQQLDPALAESAMSLGASPRRVLFTITLPLVAPGIAAGAFIGFMASFDNVAISLLLSDARSEVLPIRLWHIIEASLDVRAAAASGLLIAATVVLGVIMERLAGISRHLR